MDLWEEFHGPNAGYVLELYDRYLENPQSVDAATRSFFEHWSPPPEPPPALATARAAAPTMAPDKIVGAVKLAQSIRSYGHLAATLDPLHGHPRGDPSLEPATHGITEEDLRALPAGLIGGPVAEHASNAWEAIQALRSIYSSTTGYSYEHIHDPEERAWLTDAAESRRFYPTPETFNAVGMLERLTGVEVFEHFLQRTFPGKTRFSLEGLDMLVPMLDEILCDAAGAGIRSILLGMAHRGRLNVMANLLRKPYKQIFAEFRDPAFARDMTAREELGWTGDVRYHAGLRAPVEGVEDVTMVMSLPPNPSHLETVDPVVEGMARSAGTSGEGPGAPAFDPDVALPILVHGDAAFPGEGIVAETLNLSRLPGYRTGGTLHIISNNQLGYTTTPSNGRSTLYASDLAKGFEIPIVHVNADDVEACVEAARLASAYRTRFHKDFMIDLVGYRRYGHNEGDEPTFTQPRMYEKIQAHPSVRAIWAGKLVERGLIPAEEPDRLVRDFSQQLQSVLESVHAEEDLVEPQPPAPPRGAARSIRTGVPLDRLREWNTALVQPPEGISINSKLERTLKRRRTALDKPDERTVDWAVAEQLVLASILADSIPIRFTGEDTARGTFGHRHAVWHDVKTGTTFTPLQHLSAAKATFEIHDTPLTEAAVIGFEYGYNVQNSSRLVIWEAQYGDFVNMAQVMLDEFVASARAKWGQTPSLVLLLPHAWEGQGPDHSSGRLERFLSLAAETNMRIAFPTTAAQYFHLLRRQALLLETDPLPLVVMT
ncbi:MAG: 2-oxoglutarate dehydrogenase E1 component, partial [Rudaea sp.]